MAEHNDLGKLGEELAVDFLEKNGYEILETNWVFDKAEIDIIAQFENEIVIIEVKSRTSNYVAEPESSVNTKKKKLLILAADDFIQKNNFISEVRFDILALLKKQQSWSVNHIKNAFNASEI